jgi:hypothetical protein
VVASIDAQQDAQAASSARVWLDFTVIDAKAREIGIDTDVALAEHLGTDRSTLYRWRRRQIGVALATAMRIADRLQLTVEKIIGQEAGE